MHRSASFKDYFVHCTIFLPLDGSAWCKAMAAMVTSPTGPADRTRRGLLIVLSSPSGAGKSTISRRLMEEDPSITMSISATTRPMRPGETADVDYHFVDDEKFQQLVEADELAEWAYVFGYRYGSPKEPIKEALRSGRDTLFDIDWQGTQQLEYAFRTDLVRIFILPPSMAELRRRLVDRGTDGDEVIDFRMLRAAAIQASILYKS